MKLILAALILLNSSGCAARQPSRQFDPDWGFRPDSRAAHITGTIAASLGLYLVLNRLFPNLTKFARVTLSVSPVLTAFTAKEFYWDEAASKSDHTANLIGAGLSTGILALTAAEAGE